MQIQVIHSHRRNRVVPKPIRDRIRSPKIRHPEAALMLLERAVGQETGAARAVEEQMEVEMVTEPEMAQGPAVAPAPERGQGWVRDQEIF
ncbi:hypothetical protein BACI349Y_410016 [Bacillus sp. 349Y]|nr:hypothetical protein BACI349Y_410016 [Bacillus sp. 349Y]